MNRSPHRTPLLASLAAMAAAMVPQSAFACATCFGASDSDLAKGMNMGILALLFVVMGVLAMVGLFFVHVARRSARLDPESEPSGPTSTPMH